MRILLYRELLIKAIKWGHKTITFSSVAIVKYIKTPLKDMIFLGSQKFITLEKLHKFDNIPKIDEKFVKNII